MDEYQKVLQRLSNLGAKVVCEGIPKFVIDAFSSDETPTNTNDLESLDLNLQETLTQSQKEAVMFGISKRGKCLIADDMGLGKTYTAIALADFFRPSWPLLIVTTASLREMWKEKLQELLPYIGNYKILVQNSVMDKVGSAKIVITSYNLFERTSDHLLDKNFGLIIFDESHQLKNPKAHVTEAAKKICAKAKHIVLLSGTPALSRPIELFTQLKLLDPNFASYMNYTKRYCNGTETQFGYNDKGQSNLQELNILLTKKFMIRRMKSDVLIDLSAKIR